MSRDSLKSRNCGSRAVMNRSSRTRCSARPQAVSRRDLAAVLQFVLPIRYNRVAGLSPLATAVVSPCVIEMVTGRASTVWSGFTR